MIGCPIDRLLSICECNCHYTYKIPSSNWKASGRDFVVYYMVPVAVSIGCCCNYSASLLSLELGSSSSLGNMIAVTVVTGLRVCLLFINSLSLAALAWKLPPNK